VLAPGAIYGELRVLVPDTGNRKNGHRMTLVEDTKTGEQKEVRVDNLVSGNTQSCGRIKKERYKEKLAKMTPDTDLDGIDPAVMASARGYVGVDACTGEQIFPAERPKPKTPRVDMVAEHPNLEDRLRVVIPYLDDVQHGFITFGRVPRHMQKMDGNHIRQLLEKARIIDAKLKLTEKGMAWLAQSEI
jgi:hypothetical protein